MSEQKKNYRIKHGHTFGQHPYKTGGQIVELKPSEAAGFLDILEPVDGLIVPQVAPTPTSASDEASTGSLPEDFPYRAKLVAAGLASLEEVNAASDEQLEGIKGIGLTGVTKIRAALG